MLIAMPPCISQLHRILEAPLENLTAAHPFAQVVAIQRKDTLQWAIPGGMVDAGESVSAVSPYLNRSRKREERSCVPLEWGSAFHKMSEAVVA